MNSLYDNMKEADGKLFWSVSGEGKSKLTNTHGQAHGFPPMAMNREDDARAWKPIENMEDARACNVPLDRPVEVKDEEGNTYIAKFGLKGMSITKGFVIKGNANAYEKSTIVAFREVPEEW